MECRENANCDNDKRNVESQMEVEMQLKPQ